jgi:Domain of unknown function (DUF4421)
MYQMLSSTLKKTILCLLLSISFLFFSSPKATASVDSARQESAFIRFLLKPHRKFVHQLYKERAPYYDTSFYQSLKHQTVVSLPLIYKSQDIRLEEAGANSPLRNLIYKPNDNYLIGLMFSNRFATFVLNTGITIKQAGYSQKGKTKKHLDFNFNFYGKRLITDTYYKNYQGFYIKNSSDFIGNSIVNNSRYLLKPNLRLYAFGLSSSYIFNYKRFSYRGSFTFTEIQKKSCGTGILGLFYTYLDLTDSSGLAPSPFETYFNEITKSKRITFQTAGINIGYAHTFVIKKRLSLTGSIINGLGIDFTQQQLISSLSVQQKAAFIDKLNIRLSARYDAGRFFFGFFYIYENLIKNANSNLSITYSNTKMLVFTGIRLNSEKLERRFLKRMRLL